MNISKNFTNPNVKLLGKEIKHSKEFQKTIVNFIVKKNKSNFCSISKNQPLNDFYHTSMCFNYILREKKLKTPLEIKGLFDSNEYVKKYAIVNKNYPPNLYFSNRENSISSIYQYLKTNNFKYVLLERTACKNNNKLKEFIRLKCIKIIEDRITNDAIYRLI